jgi:FkbH-like protein
VKLIEALEILKRPVPESAPEWNSFLACGMTPLHLQTFLAARLQVRLPQYRVEIKTGLFGDLIGNLGRLQMSGLNSLVLAVEWVDLDSRLGIRNLGGWKPTTFRDIAASVIRVAATLEEKLGEISERIPTVISMPTLPLPPIFTTGRAQTSTFEVELRHTVSSLTASLSQKSGLRVLNAQCLEELSPLTERYDAKSDVLTGFPYTLSHASVMGELLASLVVPPNPKKGLITDLDDTLWAGILGEDGIEGISWHLDCQTHMHGVYQQFLAALAGAGILLGVASKNDPVAVGEAFKRSDLLISENDVFPIEAQWSRKSESIQRILKTWNVAADSVVFVDDSPMEVAEVKAAFPEMECVVFPTGQYREIWDLLRRLREMFAKSLVSKEDSIRLGSIRDAVAWRAAVPAGASTPDDFLKAAEATITFDRPLPDAAPRAFELVNKTNQFTLNGMRFGESEWKNYFADPKAFLLTIEYKDKYGPLGKIAVIMGKVGVHKLHVECWVMSCRAFSRRIEHQCLKQLFELFEVDEIAFDYRSTPRNTPFREFLTEVLEEPPVPGVNLSKKSFDKKRLPLFHRVEGTVNV